MTVRELIEQLAKYPDEWEVYAPDDRYGGLYDVNEVKMEEQTSGGETRGYVVIG